MEFASVINMESWFKIGWVFEREHKGAYHLRSGLLQTLLESRTSHRSDDIRPLNSQKCLVHRPSI